MNKQEDPDEGLGYLMLFPKVIIMTGLGPLIGVVQRVTSTVIHLGSSNVDPYPSIVMRRAIMWVVTEPAMIAQAEGKRPPEQEVGN